MKQRRGKQGKGGGADERLPLRWAVILTVAGAAAIGIGTLAGPVAGVGTGIAITGLLSAIIGH